MTISDISSFFCPTRIYMGLGAHEKLSETLRKLECKRIFVALDGALQETEFYARIRAILQDEKVAISVFTEIESDPSVETVEKAFEICRAHEATVLLAVGGGSTMDVAKAVGILATNGGRIHDYEGIEKFSIPPLPLIAVPTTAGTGSEVSGSCVISDTDKHLKMSIRHAALNPADVAILDPLALRTVPAHVAAHSGMDAFVHAFESYISRQSNLMTDAINLQAIELIAANVRQLVACRENLDAGLNMLCGSALAGMTFGARRVWAMCTAWRDLWGRTSICRTGYPTRSACPTSRHSTCWRILPSSHASLRPRALKFTAYPHLMPRGKRWMRSSPCVLTLVFPRACGRWALRRIRSKKWRSYARKPITTAGIRVTPQPAIF